MSEFIKLTALKRESALLSPVIFICYKISTSYIDIVAYKHKMLIAAW